MKARIIRGEKYHITIGRTLLGRREFLEISPVPLTILFRTYIHREGLLYDNFKSMYRYKELMPYYK